MGPNKQFPGGLVGFYDIEIIIIACLSKMMIALYPSISADYNTVNCHEMSVSKYFKVCH
jgi:hypothetical protein